MRSLGNITAFTLILALTGAILYFAYRGTLLVWENIEQLEFSLRVILVASLSSVLIAALMLIIGLRSAAFIRVRGQLAESRQSVYAYVLTMLRSVMDKSCDAAQKDSLAAELSAVSPDFFVLASSATIKSYLAFGEALKLGEEELLEPCFQSLWKDMRKDMGYNDDFDVVDIRQLINVLPRCEKADEAEMVPQT